MKLEEKTLNKNYIYKGKIINLRVDDALLPNGNSAKREVVEHPGGVCVAALTKENELLLVKQFRYPYGQEILEIPAGKREAGEDPLCCGIRELAEETGAKSDNFEFLGQIYPTPGYTDEIIYLYLAKDVTFGNANPDDDEFVEVIKMPFEQALQKVLSNEIKDSKTQIAVLMINAKKQA